MFVSQSTSPFPRSGWLYGITKSIWTTQQQTKASFTMMPSLWSTRIVLFFSCISIAASSTASFSTLGVTGVSRHAGLFGIPRGGGLFGGAKKEESQQDPLVTDESAITYPAMTKEEIEDWLEHVPVFAVTDPNGAGVVLRPENDTSVFYFFLNPLQANATLTQLKSVNEDMDLKVSAFSLGKIWFNLLQGADGEAAVITSASSGEASDASKDVEYRLVPDTRDLLGARMLLTMTPEDGEAMKESGGMTPEMAQAAIKKAMEESPKFKQTFNEIPIFTIAQMRMQKQPAEGEEGEAITLLPMYFSMQNMVNTWQEFMKSAPPDVQGVEPAINLMSLHDLVEMMQKESEIDWRHVVLVPLAPGPGGQSEMTAGAAPAADPMAQMGGATLGDE